MSPVADRATYTELAEVIAALPALVRERRRQHGASQRDAAQEIGCSCSTVARVEAGEAINTDTLTLVLRWLDGGDPQ